MTQVRLFSFGGGGTLHSPFYPPVPCCRESPSSLSPSAGKRRVYQISHDFREKFNPLSCSSSAIDIAGEGSKAEIGESRSPLPLRGAFSPLRPSGGGAPNGGLEPLKAPALVPPRGLSGSGGGWNNTRERTDPDPASSPEETRIAILYTCSFDGKSQSKINCNWN